MDISLTRVSGALLLIYKTKSERVLQAVSSRANNSEPLQRAALLPLLPHCCFLLLGRYRLHTEGVMVNVHCLQDVNLSRGVWQVSSTPLLFLIFLLWGRKRPCHICQAVRNTGPGSLRGTLSLWGYRWEPRPSRCLWYHQGRWAKGRRPPAPPALIVRERPFITGLYWPEPGEVGRSDALLYLRKSVAP